MSPTNDAGTIWASKVTRCIIHFGVEGESVGGCMIEVSQSALTLKTPPVNTSVLW